MVTWRVEIFWGHVNNAPLVPRPPEIFFPSSFSRIFFKWADKK